MEAEKAGASLDSLISWFNSRIAQLQKLVIERNMYSARSVTDLSAVDAAVKAMELHKLIDASLKQQRKLKYMSIYAPTHLPERMSMLNLDTIRCLFPESSQQNTGSGTFKLEDDPAPPPKEKKGRSTPPLWFVSGEELDSLSSYMRGRLTLEKVNAAINDMATYAEANYQLIAAPKKNVAGDRWEKALEIRDIAMNEAVKGKHFFLETDMKGPSLKLDNTGKAILTCVNRSTGFGPFYITYGYNPRAPLDLVMVPDLKRIHAKAEDFVSHLCDIHQSTKQQLEITNTQYKQAADTRRRHVEFEVGDYVWAVLTKDHFSVGEYNKLAARKIGPIEIVEKINPNAYCLKLPSHIRTADVFNVKHLIPYADDNSEDDELNSRANSPQPGEDDAARITLIYMSKFENSKMYRGRREQPGSGLRSLD